MSLLSLDSLLDRVRIKEVPGRVAAKHVYPLDVFSTVYVHHSGFHFHEPRSVACVGRPRLAGLLVVVLKPGSTPRAGPQAGI